MQIVKGCVKNILRLLVTSKLLFLLHYLVQIHILLRFRDKKRKIEDKKYSFLVNYGRQKFGFME